MSISVMPPITPLPMLSPTSPTNLDVTQSSGSGGGAQKAAGDFSKYLSDALGQVDALQKNADTASLQLATGQVQDISTVMVALQKASLSLSLTVATRDKVIDAYNQIMRMQM